MRAGGRGVRPATTIRLRAMTFYCIGDADTVRGFRLAGVEGCEAQTSTEAAAALGRALAQPDIGIVILSASVARGLGTELDRWQGERARPLIVELPGPEEFSWRGRGLLDLVNEAVGVRVPEEKGG